jgi:glyoxylate reductase
MSSNDYPRLSNRDSNLSAAIMILLMNHKRSFIMTETKNKPSLVIVGKVQPIILKLLQTKTTITHLEDFSGPNAALLDKALLTADGLFASSALAVDETLLNKAPQLKVISQPHVGVDNIDIDACTTRRIPVGHTPGVLVEATADLFFGLLLSSARRISEGWNFVKSGFWGQKHSFPLGTDLYGKTLGIVGMGRIGTAVAKRAQASGLSVIYHNRRPRPDSENLHTKYVSFNELLASADFIMLLVPLTKESYHLFGATEFAKMKSTAYLINGARGKIVDSQALYQALNTGEIAFAALDVTDPEPLPINHPLLTLSNILITPHIGSATHETREAMARLAAENVINGLAGKSLPACANPQVNF